MSKALTTIILVLRTDAEEPLLEGHVQGSDVLFLLPLRDVGDGLPPADLPAGVVAVRVLVVETSELLHPAHHLQCLLVYRHLVIVSVNLEVEAIRIYSHGKIVFL